MNVMSIATLRSEVLHAAKQLVKLDLVSLSGGNVSARDPDTQRVIVTPSGQSYGEMREDDLVVINLEGDKVDGHWKPTADLHTHLAIYREHDYVNCIMHTHSTYATALAVTGEELPPITSVFANMVSPGPVPVIPYADTWGENLADYVNDALNKNLRAVLLRNHGVIAVGPSVTKALKSAVTLEDTAEIYIATKGIQMDVDTLTSEQARESFRFYQDDYGQS